MTKNPTDASRRSSTMKKKTLAAVVIVVALAITVPLGFTYVSAHSNLWGFQPYVYYSYVVGVSSDSVSRFTVLCPFPANEDGIAPPNSFHSLRIVGNATATNVTTERGIALKIVGIGLVIVTWTSQKDVPRGWNANSDYSHLALVAGSTAEVNSDTANLLFDLSFHYNHVYGNVGADFVSYETTGSLQPGWNALHLDYRHAVA